MSEHKSPAKHSNMPRFNPGRAPQLKIGQQSSTGGNGGHLDHLRNQFANQHQPISVNMGSRGLAGISSPLNNQLKGASSRSRFNIQGSTSIQHSIPSPSIAPQSQYGASNNNLKQLFIEDYQEITDGPLLRQKVQPYFKSIFADIALRSHTPKAKDEEGLFIDNVAFFEYTMLPGIISDRFHSIFEKKGEKLDGPIGEKSFVDGLTKVYLSCLTDKMKMTFKMFDFDNDGFISKEDARILLSYVPFKGSKSAKSPLGRNSSHKSIPSNVEQEGMYEGQDKDYNERVEEQDKILTFLETVFENQPKINFADYDRINREVSSEMFYSIMFTLHERLPCTQNFFKLKRDYRNKNFEPLSPISPMAIKSIASPKYVSELSAVRQRKYTLQSADCSPTLVRGTSPALSRSPDIRIKKGVSPIAVRNRSRQKADSLHTGQDEINDISMHQSSPQQNMFYQTQGTLQINGQHSQRQNFQKNYNNYQGPGVITPSKQNSQPNQNRLPQLQTHMGHPDPNDINSIASPKALVTFSKMRLERANGPQNFSQGTQQQIQTNNFPRGAMQPRHDMSPVFTQNRTIQGGNQQASFYKTNGTPGGVGGRRELKGQMSPMNGQQHMQFVQNQGMISPKNAQVNLNQTQQMNYPGQGYQNNNETLPKVIRVQPLTQPGSRQAFNQTLNGTVNLESNPPSNKSLHGGQGAQNYSRGDGSNTGLGHSGYNNTLTPQPQISQNRNNKPPGQMGSGRVNTDTDCQSNSPAISINMMDETTSSVYSMAQTEQVNVIEGFGDVGQGDEDLISASGYCYLKSKHDNFKKHWLVIVGNELYFYKRQGDEEHKIMHCLSGTYIREPSAAEENPANNQLPASKNNPAQQLYPVKIAIPPNKSRLTYFVSKEEVKSWTENLQTAMQSTNITQFYELDKTLGKGQFGLVKLAFHKKDQRKVAIKQVKKRNMTHIEVFQQRREIEVLKMCQHPNIIHLVDIFENSDNYYIVLDYMAGSDLFDYLQARDFNLGEARVRELSFQLAKGIEYLHSYGIVHRDMKLENVMMTDTSDGSVPKLVDFGLAKMIGPGVKAEEPFGTLGYVAPEILEKKPYSFQCDLWSLGCIIYALMTSSLPFDHDSQKETIRMTCEDDVIFDSQTWKSYSADSKDIITRLLIKNPEKRITLQEVIDHKWFKNIKAKIETKLQLHAPRKSPIASASYSPINGIQVNTNGRQPRAVVQLSNKSSVERVFCFEQSQVQTKTTNSPTKTTTQYGSKRPSVNTIESSPTVKITPNSSHQ